MGRSEFSNLGDEIRESVQSAINKGDFSRLNSELRESVNYAMEELKRSIQYTGGTGTDKTVEHTTDRVNTGRTQAGGTTVTGTAGVQAVNRPVRVTSLPVKPVGKVGSVLFTVFGSILLGLGILFLMIFSTIGAATGGTEALFSLAMILGLPTTAAGAWMLAAGRQRAGRISRMNQYVKLAGTRGYCDLKELAERTGRSARYILKDLKKMIRLGMFPEGHLDDKKTCFMLDNKTHQLYLEMKRAREQQASEAGGAEASGGTDGTGQEAAGSEEQAAVRKVVREGREYISQIRQANAAIKGEEISAKLDRLSNIMDKIFLYIEGHPEKLEELHKFMEYYLPTTLKLVDAYQEFDSQPVQGENITRAKREIEETLDTINEAFTRLFDNLYADAAMDISTDIDVLEAMFAQEGLTGHSFQK